MRLRVCMLMAFFTACTANTFAQERRDIVFDCPCAAEWVSDASNQFGTLTLEAGIRSLRAMQSGDIALGGTSRRHAI